MKGFGKYCITLNMRCFVFALLVFLGCKKESDDTETQSEPFNITFNPDSSFQTIAGFGGANRMWGTEFLKPAEAKIAFGLNEEDLGLSIFRVRLAANPTEWPLILESVKEAQKYGVKIFASPWSPPPNLKSNKSEIGGNLLPENYEVFKDHIISFVAYMKTNGVDIHAVSIQNEPDIQVSYESCNWTSTNMINFLKTYGQLINDTKIAAPESFNFNSNFTNELLRTNEAAQNLNIIAGHIYGGELGPVPLAEQKGKEIWMTEYLLNLSSGNIGTRAWASYSESEKWDESLTMLYTIHKAMTSNWNAYIWWYLQRYYSFIGDGEQGTTNGTILKRGYAFSHFSKFIRPGFVRVDISTSTSSGIETTAYKGSNQYVVVILNRNNNSVNNINIKFPSISVAEAYETSLNSNRLTKSIKPSGDKVVLNISPKSITTIVVKK